MTQSTWDVIIIGGGIMGSSTAYHLMRIEPNLKLAVLEPDPTYTHASTTLSLANIRIQFSLEENIRISQYTMEVLENFDQEMAVGDKTVNVAFKPEGNLFLVDNTSEDMAKAAFDLQKSLGCQIDWWSPEQIQTRFPEFEPTEFTGATFGSRDGHLDAFAFLNGFRNKAASLGAHFIKDEAVGVLTEPHRVAGVRTASDDTVLLLPECPDESALSIREIIEKKLETKVGILIIDSFGRAWRLGTIGTAVGLSGLPGLIDLRGKSDMYGRCLRTTEVGAADELASAASLVMGQSDERVPVVHVRGFPYSLREANHIYLRHPQ